MKIKCIDKFSKDFPEKLKQLDNCPTQIFVLGNESILKEFSLAVVGSRKCTSLGMTIAQDISDEISNKKITIISGFARGIDSIAHKSCIENNSKTIVVLGGGHGKIYPKENITMIDKIIKNSGAIISEYPMEYPSIPNNFRERNRIIAALSDGVILIEAKVNSGSLITVKYAKELNKNIFVVPGCLGNELYAGSNYVLSEGAYCIRNADDILKRYPEFHKEKNNKKEKQIRIDESLKNVYENLLYTPQTLDEISLKTKEPINRILSKLALLEIQDLVKRLDGQKFVKVN